MKRSKSQCSVPSVFAGASLCRCQTLFPVWKVDLAKHFVDGFFLSRKPFGRGGVAMRGSVARDVRGSSVGVDLEGGIRVDPGRAATATGSLPTKPTEGPKGPAEPPIGRDLEGFQKMLHEEGVAGSVERAGDLIKLGPHGRASANRAALGVSGARVQSAHIAPQGLMNKAPNYNPDHALARLMERTKHTGMDHLWKRDFDAMRDARRQAALPTTATIEEIHNVIAGAIDRAPGIPPGKKQSLIARLSDEVFAESGLAPTVVVKIPQGFKR
jgi:hypothetical protein